METVILIIKILAIASLVVACVAIFLAALLHNGEDERNSRTRYGQADKIVKP